MVDKLHKDPVRKAEFPRLSHLNHAVKSPISRLYNCIAFAMGDEFRQWWPDPMNVGYWPSEVPRLETIEAFTEMLKNFGFSPTSVRRAERNVSKVALYALSQSPKHLAKQLPNGKWWSKLGDAEDVHHTLEALEGPQYGQVVRIFSKKT